MATTSFDVGSGTLAPQSQANEQVGVVRAWLFGCAFLVFCIVIVGGATRLTDSGLSITEWQPIIGALPPLSDADWLIAFEKYKQIPEYIKVNDGMSMADFKFIYWWEWGHRQLGRLIGLALLLPLIAFWALGWIPKSYRLPLLFTVALVGVQGALGWYMVASGLVGRVDVSQYRLAAHLTLALVIFSLLIWFGLKIGRDRGQGSPALSLPLPRWLSMGAGLLLGLIFMQIAMGALVAGMRAGLAYNTWPLMDGAFIPDGLAIMKPVWLNAFENALTVQFNHRMMAYALAALIVGYVLSLRAMGGTGRVWHTAVAMVSVLAVQIVLGILTVLWQVPISLGLLHQGGAVVLLGLAVWHFFEMRHAPRLTAA